MRILLNKSNLIIILLLLTSFFSYGQTSSAVKSSETIALEYMKAYGNWDFEKMKTFYDENIHFEDPTAAEAFKSGFETVGKEKVYTMFKGVYQAFENNKPPYISINVDKIFSSGSFVVINSTYESILPNSWYKNSNTEKIMVSIPFLTVLQIKNGKITIHKDYADYDTWTKQIQAQLTKK
ncbi:nuclear transport factor 2 family protein [Pontimicrobium aquaticum]|uniref:Nuclear transport factor 2 family protein n=1 Tax=Pontimicrobium aquaticum TaxID=2565367 RepID=A0A4U0F063_9FLAO|nr:nuclear transport factor 2 family protein [Pontimicrobium aquaticum]TJY37791.1 nuclear transport factor 2 family protein [Pontimicrobium aquaticum]